MYQSFQILVMALCKKCIVVAYLDVAFWVDQYKKNE